MYSTQNFVDSLRPEGENRALIESLRMVTAGIGDVDNPRHLEISTNTATRFLKIDCATTYGTNNFYIDRLEWR